jgi:hypothetical protein
LGACYLGKRWLNVWQASNSDFCFGMIKLFPTPLFGLAGCMGWVGIHLLEIEANFSQLSER